MALLSLMESMGLQGPCALSEGKGQVRGDVPSLRGKQELWVALPSLRDRSSWSGCVLHEGNEEVKG